MSVNEKLEIGSDIVMKLDIRGKFCPMTFIYTKLTLEEMDKGELLEVLVDYPPAVENIPYSCKRQDLAEILEIKEIDAKKKVWQLNLKKV